MSAEVGFVALEARAAQACPVESRGDVPSHFARGPAESRCLSPEGVTSLYHELFAYGLGAFLAVAVIYAAERMQSDQRWLFTWVIAIVILGFLGFPVAVADWSATGVEAAIIVVLGGLLVISWFRSSAVLLGIVYLGHGASDLVHLALELSPSNPQWLHEMCVPFDWLLGVYILVRRRQWSRTHSNRTLSTPTSDARSSDDLSSEAT